MASNSGLLASDLLNVANSGGRNPYGADEGYRYGTVSQFCTENRGCTYDEIVTQLGIDKYNQPRGPSLRFVQDPTNPNKYIDMRHMLVVAKRYGAAGGFGIEILEMFMGSAGHVRQDMWSNGIGEIFFENFNFYIRNDPRGFSNYLEKYLNNYESYGDLIID